MQYLTINNKEYKFYFYNDYVFIDLVKIADFFNKLIDENAFIANNKKRNAENIKAIFKTKNHIFVTDKGNVIAHIMFPIKEEKYSHVATIGIAIDKNYRNKGIGKKLLELAIEELKNNKNIKIIQLSVFSTNKIAKQLYEKFGFKKVATIPKVLKHNNKFYDEDIYHLYLSKF